jgi:hypothetical protein
MVLIVKETVNTTKAAPKIQFPLIKLNAGDQTSTPIRNTAEMIKAIMLLKLKQELIIPAGRSAFGRNLIIQKLTPIRLKYDSRDMAEMAADPKPTSTGV